MRREKGKKQLINEASSSPADKETLRGKRIRDEIPTRAEWLFVIVVQGRLPYFGRSLSIFKISDSFSPAATLPLFQSTTYTMHH